MDPARSGLFCRWLVERGVVGGVAHVLGEVDESPAHVQIVDGASIVLGVDDGHRRAREPGEILPAAGLGQRLVVLEVGLERHRVRDLSTLDHVQHGVIDSAVHGQEEVLRLQKGGDQMDGLVVDEKGAQKRLLGFKIARQRAHAHGVSTPELGLDNGDISPKAYPSDPGFSRCRVWC